MPQKRVAVIAVHGVADQQPGQTNRAIANLLSNVNDGDAPAYEAFQVRPLQIPVRPVPVPDRARHEAQSFGEFAASERRRMTLEARTEIEDVDLAFTASLLAKYEPSGPDETYHTTVLRGRRGPDDAGADTDVYEFYWADLSRLTRSWWRMFAEIYQILFHLGSLGVHAIRAAVASEPGEASPAAWARWATWQRRAANLLAHDILLFNLLLAGLSLVILVVWLGPITSARLATAAIAAAAAIAAGVATYRSSPGQPAARALGAGTLAAGLAGGATAWALARGLSSERLLATLVMSAVATAVVVVARFYDRQRPGAARHALVYSAGLAVFVITRLWAGGPGSGSGVPNAVMHGAEAVYFALRVLWIVFLAQAIAAFLAGRAVVGSFSGAPQPAADRIARLNWTARLTLSVPAFLFLLLTVALWAALWSAISGPALNVPHDPLPTTTWMLLGASPGTIQAVADALITTAAGPGLTVLLGLVALATLMAVVAVAPSVLAEILPPAEPRDGTRGGRWLDSGFIVMRWAGRLLVFGVIVVLPLGFFVELGVATRWPEAWASFTAVNSRVIVAFAAAFTAGGAGLVVFGDRLKQITLGFRSALDVLLDVDNYLREHPRRATPRARMFARGASLLRHVNAQSYDAVVIVSHSQGSVIVADLLRFLHRKDIAAVDPSLRFRLPVSLFTMGSPLRQLYALRFPHLYRWASPAAREPWVDPRTAIPHGVLPRPEDLGLARWVNAYRSGDYIGRAFWRPDGTAFLYATARSRASHPWLAGPFEALDSVSAPPAPDRREFCVGSGAHTHYWDGTAPQVALQVDALIMGQ